MIASVQRFTRRSISAAVGALLWGGGCSSSSTEGVAVTIVTEASNTTLVEGARVFDDSGVKVTLSRGYLNTGGVEIVSCGATAFAHSTRDTLASLFGMREVLAHVVGSPTTLGAPSIESLVAAAGARSQIGLLHPPAGSYCKVKQTILAADHDASGMPSDGVMLGQSLFVEGTYSTVGAAPKPFRLASTASFDVETTIPTMSLSVDDRRTATVVLVKASDHWFDGVDFAGDSRDTTTKILSNVRASLGVRVE